MQLSEKSRQKIKTYLGFCIKAGKAIYGCDNIENAGRLKLIVIDETLSENAVKKIDKKAQELGVKIIKLEGLEALISKVNCKALALKEKHLADAIILEVEKDGRQ